MALPKVPAGYICHPRDFFRQRGDLLPVGGVRQAGHSDPVVFFIKEKKLGVAAMYDKEGRFWLAASDVYRTNAFPPEGPYPTFESLMVVARISGYERIT